MSENVNINIANNFLIKNDSNEMLEMVKTIQKISTELSSYKKQTELMAFDMNNTSVALENAVKVIGMKDIMIVTQSEEINRLRELLSKDNGDNESI